MASRYGRSDPWAQVPIQRRVYRGLQGADPNVWAVFPDGPQFNLPLDSVAQGFLPGLRLAGWSVREASGLDVAEFVLETFVINPWRDPNSPNFSIASGATVYDVELDISEAQQVWLPFPGVYCPSGIALEPFFGAMDLTIFYWIGAPQP